MGRFLGEETRRSARWRATGYVILFGYLAASFFLAWRYAETPLERSFGFFLMAACLIMVLLALRAKPVRIYENGLVYGHFLKTSFVHWDSIDVFEDLGERGFMLKFHDPYVVASSVGGINEKIIFISTRFPNYSYVRDYVQTKVEGIRPRQIVVEVRGVDDQS